MSPLQKMVLALTLLGAAAVLFFPPWDYTRDGYSIHSRNPATRSSILNPPVPQSGAGGFGVKISVDRMMVEVGAVLAFGAGLFMFASVIRRRSEAT